MASVSRSLRSPRSLTRLRLFSASKRPDLQTDHLTHIADDQPAVGKGHRTPDVFAFQNLTDAETTLDVSSTLAERLRPVHGPLEMSNFPNPFKASTIIRIRGQGALDDASLEIYNLNGRKIVDLTPSLRAGAAQMKWNGTDGLGKKVPSGLYCCRLASGAKTVHRIMLLAK